MPSSFRAYIDESGDDGFNFKPDGTGSSAWFILSAVVVRTEKDGELIGCLSGVKSLLGRQPSYALHFTELKKHDQRKAYLACLAKAPIKTISIVAYKKMPVASNPFSAEKDMFYRYMTRLLVERISWLCRDHRKPGVGDGLVELTFSNKGSMSYEAIRNYLTVLKLQPPEKKVTIEWSVIDAEKVTAVAHEKMAGLQAADAVASSVYAAVNLNRFNQTETAYASLLRPIFYRYKGRLWGYGIKWWPCNLEKMQSANPHLKELADWK
jgi:hypothetical protein